jgi:hypothetical protein
VGNKDKSSVATLYVDIEMSGIHFVEAKGFKIKPLIALLQEKGPITAKAGKLVSVLPEKGRAAQLSEFAKACKLD